MDVQHVAGHIRADEVTIASGESESSIYEMGGCCLLSFKAPSGWDTADMTFLGSSDGETFSPIYNDSGIEAQSAVVAGVWMSQDLNAIALSPLQYIKFRSGTASSPVAQAAERIIEISSKG
jgi:hypothetical protein